MLGRAGSATPSTLLPTDESVDFDPMISRYLTLFTRYVPRQVYPDALLPLPPIFPMQLVTVTTTGTPRVFNRSMRELSWAAEMKLTVMAMANAVNRSAPVANQNRPPIRWASGPRSEENSLVGGMPFTLFILAPAGALFVNDMVHEDLTTTHILIGSECEEDHLSSIVGVRVV